MTYTINPTIDEKEIEGLSNKEVVSKFKNISLIKDIYSINSGVCYNYALNDYNLEDCVQAMEELENCYQIIKRQDAKKGDVISFHNDVHSAVHFGIVEQMNDEVDSILIKSKWGFYGVFLTDLKSLPDFYGNLIVFWRKNS